MPSCAFSPIAPLSAVFSVLPSACASFSSFASEVFFSVRSAAAASLTALLASASVFICEAVAFTAFCSKSASSASLASVLPLCFISAFKTFALPCICVATLPCTFACFMEESAEIIACILACDSSLPLFPDFAAVRFPPSISSIDAPLDCCSFLCSI